MENATLNKVPVDNFSGTKLVKTLMPIHTKSQATRNPK
jgi:hypothetical protein